MSCVCRRSNVSTFECSLWRVRMGYTDILVYSALLDVGGRCNQVCNQGLLCQEP